MKTVEVDVYVVVGLHHESRLAAEGGDPHVTHHRFVRQVSVHSSSGSAISMCVFSFTCRCLQSRPG